MVVDRWSGFGGLNGWRRDGVVVKVGRDGGEWLRRCGEEELWNIMNNAGKR